VYSFAVEFTSGHLHKAVVGVDVLEALERLTAVAMDVRQDSRAQKYEFDRKFLFKMLVLGNAQLAQIIHARGPNAQTNAACAGTTQVPTTLYCTLRSIECVAGNRDRERYDPHR
jgi:hypothetical protein